MGYRDEDEAVRARLDAVLAENAALKAELAERGKPRAPVAPRAPAPAARPSSTPPLAGRGRNVVVLALLGFVSPPGLVFTALASRGGMSLAPALVMDAVALFALGAVLYAKYGPEIRACSGGPPARSPRGRRGTRGVQQTSRFVARLTTLFT